MRFFHPAILSALLALLSVSVSAQQRQLSQNQDGFNSSLYEGGLNDTPQRDSTVVEREVPHDFIQFVINPLTGLADTVPLDTAMKDFHFLHLTEGTMGTYNNLGNMGSPRYSRLFSERPSYSHFMFDAPYDFTVKDPLDFRFTDTKCPHINLTYFKGGDKINGEEHLKGYFAANFNKKSGIGLNMDYQLGRGRYDNQATSFFDTRAYYYRHGEVYRAHASFNIDNLKVTENGGIENDLYITDPQAMAEGKKEYNAEDIPTVMENNWNHIQRRQFLLTQNIDLRQKIEHTDSVGDTVLTRVTYKKISTIANTTEVGSLKRRFLSYRTPSAYYENDYLINDSVDLFRNFYVDNTLSLNLLEGFSKWAVAGLTAYARYELRSYTMADTLAGGPSTEYDRRENETNIVIGGMMKRSGGKNLDFNFKGETVLAGADFGNFDLSGELDLTFPLLGKQAGLKAEAAISAEKPAYYMEHYHSQHYWWDKELDKQFTTSLRGTINVESTGTRLTFGLTNLNNYTYFAADGSASESTGTVYDNITIVQKSDALQVLDASLSQNFRLGPLHWDNDVTWQRTSNEVVLPLPDLNVFSNLYLKFVYAKRLSMEVGASVTYFTEYYAPDYSPALGEFHLQNEQDKMLIGNYPLVNAYVNCQLRGVRFYVMMYHVNDGLLKNVGDPFWVPHYPINPSMLKLGLSWTFFD